MGDTTQWKKGRLLGSGGGGKVWYGMTQEKIEVRRLLSLVCRSLELETYSRFSHEQLFVEESRESFVQSVIKVGYKVEW